MPGKNKEKEEQGIGLLRLLMVEESEADTLRMARVLEDNGYELVLERVDSPRAFLRALEDRTWDLILCSYSLPHLTSLEVIEICKTRGLDIPFIVISDAHGEEAAVEVMRAGAHDYLLKGNLARLIPAVARELKEAENRRERRQTEKALRESEERLEMALLGADLGTWDWNIQTGRVIYNERWAQMLGYRLDEIDPYVGFFRKMLHPEDRERVEQALNDHCQGRTPYYEVEVRVKTKSGQWKHLLDRGKVVERDAEGRPIRAAGTHLDISRRRESEEEAKVRQQKLIKADKMISLGILVSGMAHEINNPNHFIMANTVPLQKAWTNMKPILDRYLHEVGDFVLGGMRYSEISERIASMFASIVEGSRRIKTIVEELRDYAIDRPAGLFEEVQINHVVKSAVTLLSSMLNRSTKTFTLDTSKNIPRIRGNYQRLEQVIINLIHNACQALENRNQAITVRTFFDEKENCVVIEVRDEGVGIPEKALGRVTDLFYTTKRDSGGMGLGMAISSNIVMEHKGELDLASRPGEGTTMQVRIPVVEVDGNYTLEQTDKSPRKTTRPEEGAAGEGQA